MDRPMASPLAYEEIYSAPLSQVWKVLPDEAAMRGYYLSKLMKHYRNDGTT